MEHVSKKILIVDDSDTFVMYLGILLRRMGFKVIPASNGVEMIKLMKILPPDLVLLDVNMPIMDGVSALRLVKSDDELGRIPVVMVSVRADEETMTSCREQGAEGFLWKPVNVTDLYDQVNSLLKFPSGKTRRHLRIPFQEKVTVTYDGEEKEYFTVTLSEGGIYLRTKDPLPSGTRIQATIPLPERTLAVNGSVIYSKDIFGDLVNIDPGMAVEFEALDGPDDLALKRFLLGRFAGDLCEEDKGMILRMEMPEEA